MRYESCFVHRNVFRAYDIRGIVGEDLDVHSYYSIGRALSCQLRALQRNAIFLGRDGRLSSESLATALKQGLLDSGIDVIDLGAVATPVVYYATAVHPVDSGLMVTGSHNPAEYNGLKIVLAGNTLRQKDMDKLYEAVQNKAMVEGKGEETTLDILEEYSARVVSDIEMLRPLKVVVDCGNGVVGPVAPAVLTRLGCTVIPLFCEVDGRFPNHHPDPTIESNLEALKAAVAAHNADLGIAFDGDADRLGLVTNLGEMICPDRLMMLCAKELLARNPGASIVYDVKCSTHLATIIKTSGGKALMCPTGHSIVKAFMKETNAALAGEMSGHIFFKDRWYGFDDALYAACRILEIIAAQPLSVDACFKAIPNSVNTPEIKIAISETQKFSFMERFCASADFPGGTKIDLDGLRVEFTKGWGLVRASNTTPCLVARFEAEDLDNLRTIQALFRAQLHKVDPELALSF